MLPQRLSLALAASALLIPGACRASEPPPPRATLPSVIQNEPGAGDPPVVWVAGTLEVLDQGHLAIREGSGGEGPRIRLERLAEGATDFYRLDGEVWRELSPEEVDQFQVGERACVEALLDGQTFLALRVFLDASCGPSGPI
jgi:hypothetical protein